MIELENILVHPESSIREVMACIDRNAKGIALVVNERQHLIGTVTDGDIRRAVLAGINLEEPVSQLLTHKIDSPYPSPVVALVGTSPTSLLQIMRKHKVRHIPLLDDVGRVVGLVTLEDLLREQEPSVEAVIMAGGFGTRLRPLTEELPKPMLPIGGRPLMEWTIEQLRRAGVEHINVTTHYKPEKIIDYFGDGRDFGVKLNYLIENHPLGTAGALGLMEEPTKPLLVINGDILTQVNFRSMLSFHQEHKADMTIAVRKYDFRVPYGVVESDGTFVQKLVEKPTYSFFVNAGIYLLEPSAHRLIPRGQHFDMTDLIHRLLEEGRTVVGFPIVEYWLDIGRPADYERAQEDMAERRL